MVAARRPKKFSPIGKNAHGRVTGRRPHQLRPRVQEVGALLRVVLGGIQDHPEGDRVDEAVVVHHDGEAGGGGIDDGAVQDFFGNIVDATCG